MLLLFSRYWLEVLKAVQYCTRAGTAQLD